MPQKENNRRIYPGESSRNRPDHAEARRSAAIDRQKAYDQLSIQDKIRLLDEKFGVGQGAGKQRKKLLALLEKEKHAGNSQPKPDTTPTNLSEATLKEIDAINQEHSGKKKLKAKDRRKQEHKND